MPEVMGLLLGPRLLWRVHAARLPRGSRLAGIVGNRDSRPSWERYVGITGQVVPGHLDGHSGFAFFVVRREPLRFPLC